MKISLFAPLGAFALLLSAVPAFANEAQCFQNDAFLVIAEERTEDVGMNLLVRAPAHGKIKCEYVEQSGDFVVNPAGEPLWYEGLIGNYLILTRSTGPDGNLVVYDLETRELFIDESVDDDLNLSDEAVTYWQRFEDGTAENCPEFEEYTGYGLGAVIAREQVFDIASGTVRATGEKRCSATQ